MFLNVLNNFVYGSLFGPLFFIKHILEISFYKMFVFRDAEDAVRSRDGYDYDGYRLRVEFPKGGGSSFRGGRSAGRGPPARR